MTTRQSDTTINVRKDVTMHHVALCVNAKSEPVAVAVTTNPLEHGHFAQVIMHKTRSHQCAMQVARYVRRTFGIEEPVTTHHAVRPVEAMTGYACHAGRQYPPQEDTPWHPIVLHIASTPIATLLKEVANGHNVARTRYVVYEVRCGADRLRGVTHKFNALERRYREAPPDAFGDRPCDIVQVGRFATQEEATRLAQECPSAGDHLWSRKPSPDYVRRHLGIRLSDNEISWIHDWSPAVRRYDFAAVCIGPHVYTEHQIRHVLEHGTWPPDGRTNEGRRLLAQI
jgi:hypothetical protein